MSDPEWPPVKAQGVRLIDVFVLGPAMMVAGAMVIKKKPVTGAIVLSGGALTMAFNAANYEKIQQRGDTAAVRGNGLARIE